MPKADGHHSGGELMEFKQSCTEAAIAAERRLHPEHWEKADAIARIVEPGVWESWYRGTGPHAEQVAESVKTKYLQARAIHRAWKILKYLEIVPLTTDWEAIFEEIKRFEEEG